MRDSTIAHNYAEALFEAAEKSDNTELFGDLMDALVGAINADPTVRVVLESPRVPKAAKETILSRALEDRAPTQFVAFLRAVIKRGRQTHFESIRDEYLGLVDEKFNRVHAGVVLAREPDESLKTEIKRRLSEVLSQEVIPHYRIDSRILGGVIVRIGDKVMDGSLQRKMRVLREQMLGGS